MKLSQMFGSNNKIIHLVVIVLTGLSILGLWLQFELNQTKLYNSLLKQAESRVLQVSNAVGEQFNVLFDDLHHSLNKSIKHSFTVENVKSIELFENLSVSQKKLVKNAHVYLADGSLIYSKIPLKKSDLIQNHGFFELFGSNEAICCLVGKPLFSDSLNVWALPLYIPIYKNKEFFGVVRYDLSPYYLSEVLKKSLVFDNDILALLDNEGVFLSRTPKLKQALGKRVKKNRPFLKDQLC